MVEYPMSTKNTEEEYLKKLKSALFVDNQSAPIKRSTQLKNSTPAENPMEELIRNALMTYFHQNPNFIKNMIKNMFEEEEFCKNMVYYLLQIPGIKGKIELIMEKGVKNKIKGMVHDVLRGLLQDARR
jgi:hypothetical protein